MKYAPLCRRLVGASSNFLSKIATAKKPSVKVGSAVRSFVSTHKAGQQVSGSKDQYILEEDNFVRQDLLNRLFRDTSKSLFVESGLVTRAMEEETFRVLEIGCGVGLSTVSLAQALPETVRITAVDTSENLIETAQRNLLSNHPDKKDRIQFICANGESLQESMANTFDAVWMRFILIHVPDPNALLKSAQQCLKQSSLLLSEEVDVGGLIADPPFLASNLLHKAIAELSQKLGGDQYRGPRIGGYMHNIGMADIRCNSFVPLYGRGVTVNPSCSMQELQQDERFELVVKFLRMTGELLVPVFLKFNILSQADLNQIRDSFDAVSSSGHYQLFSSPGGKIFQTWSFKAADSG